MKHELEVEHIPPEKSPIDGNRIVDINLVFNRLITLSERHARSCSFGNLSITKEVIKGLESCIYLKCNLCDRTYQCHTFDKSFDINKACVYGTLATGSTHGHTEELFSVMNIPTLSKKTFYALQDDLSTVRNIFFCLCVLLKIYKF